MMSMVGLAPLCGPPGHDALQDRTQGNWQMNPAWTAGRGKGDLGDTAAWAGTRKTRMTSRTGWQGRPPEGAQDKFRLITAGDEVI